MFENVDIPYGAYWSTPFCRWLGSLAHLHSLKFAAHVARAELRKRDIAPAAFDHGVLGMTTPQQATFHGLAWLMSEIGAPQAGGPLVAQACATSARCLAISAGEVAQGTAECSLSLSADRVSNSPVVTYPNPLGPNGAPDTERWILDNLAGPAMVPFADEPMTAVAENCAREWQIDTAAQHAVALRRFEQYEDALRDDRAFQRRFMTLPFAVPDQRFAKTAATLAGDEGIPSTSAEKLAQLKPVIPGGTVTYGGQTRPADGSAAIVVTTSERARELATDPNIRVRLLSFGQARTRLKMMPHAPVPAAQAALRRAGLAIGDIAAIKSHNPFAVNDIVFAKETGIDVMTMNNYGCSLVWGHPNGPTGMRLVIELIEELALKGGGYGLMHGCAAGDLGMAIVVKVEDRKGR
jgi:acetyl-CoA acetyltransferase family protein